MLHNIISFMIFSLGEASYIIYLTLKYEIEYSINVLSIYGVDKAVDFLLLQSVANLKNC